MIPPAAATALPAPVLTAEALTQPGAATGETADFGAVLAGQTAAAVMPMPEAAKALPPQTETIPEGEAAIAAARTGKILPLALPEEALSEPAVAADDETSAPAPTGEAVLAAAALPSLVTLPQPATLPAAPAAEGAEPDAPVPGSKRTIPVLPESASETAKAQMIRHAAPHPAHPDTPARRAQPAEAVRAGESPPAPTTSAAAAKPAAPPAPAEEVRLTLALPRTGVLAAPLREDARTLPAAATGLSAEAAAAGSAPSAPSVSAAPVPAPTTLPVRPHDFAALVERIAVAREAAAPQAVAMSVQHQDFGLVRLHFRSEEAGLSVALTSPNPDFARAAAAAPAPILPVTASEAATTAQGRSEGAPGQAAGGQGGQPHQRGTAADPRRDAHPQPNTPAPRRPGPDGSAPRAGIYA